MMLFHPCLQSFGVPWLWAILKTINNNAQLDLHPHTHIIIFCPSWWVYKVQTWSESLRIWVATHVHKLYIYLSYICNHFYLYIQYIYIEYIPFLYFTKVIHTAWFIQHLCGLKVTVEKTQEPWDYPKTLADSSCTVPRHYPRTVSRWRMVVTAPVWVAF